MKDDIFIEDDIQKVSCKGSNVLFKYKSIDLIWHIELNGGFYVFSLSSLIFWASIAWERKHMKQM